MKEKYIYRIYKNCKNEIHCQRHPIVYSNSDYVYYKEPSCKELTKVETYRIHKAYSDTVEFGYFLSEPPEYIRNQFPGKEIVAKIESLKVGIRQHQYEIHLYTQNIEKQKQMKEEKEAQLVSLVMELETKGIKINI